MSEPFIGEIRLFPYNFAPRGWAFCNGQLLSIGQNTALFSLLGTTYGGNGQTTFALPDLRGRVAISSGQGSGLANYVVGQIGGEEGHALITSEMPSHNHQANANTAGGNSQNPQGNYWSADASGGSAAYSSVKNAQMNAAAIGNTGGSQPHNNVQPYLTLNYCIALQGIYPARD